MDATAWTSQTRRPGLMLGAMLLAVTLPACGSSAGAPEDASSEQSDVAPEGDDAGDAAEAADADAEGGADEDSTGAADPADGEDSADQEDSAAADAQADAQAEAEPAELPGGGDTLFPDRRFLAAYGAPGIPALGVLGEGEPEDAAERVKFYAEQYQEHSEEPVQPAFEIITSIATNEPGLDGNYSNALDPEVIEPWVDLAAEEDIYVVLDLQPGHASFLDQAQRYEEFLAQPHVGLALDPEWRLSEGQRHMEQIGSVSAEEINEVADWLAGLTAEHELPQKLLVLHQFNHAMISSREEIDTSHEELAILLHADGHGTPQMKTETYETLQQGLSEDIWLGWKNFYDEDSPTFTSEQTFDVDPKPWFVSYQ
ncbi:MULTISPECIES: hypothetical protein [unclassified Nesterenkonia]|uniref:hypothetical protein n=1 Tax=unclassified Nesterenkonia TaxID=2629769 RepID=UPI001F4C9BBD|nr:MULTISPECIES: hypothetical protein [unclassified Nesterenkonia]MCH8561472.1 hypothetical protein [Nesterenkonia sp. DZ6]MCH8571923.1 hypothetical protein [Nesterenkonia sp. AY15]